MLDTEFLGSLGDFDIVYSWGVLHHTGDMWAALGNACSLVTPGGKLFISLYNDQGRASRMWTRIKRQYNLTGPVGRWVLLNGVDLTFRVRAFGPLIYRRLVRLRPKVSQPRDRGMERRHDMIDWVGGYPFEVSKPEEVFDFVKGRGFSLARLKTCGGGLGCNEYVFCRDAFA